MIFKKNIHFLLLLFFLTSCENHALSVNSINPQLETMHFDVVEKELILEGDYPENTKNLIKKWFNDKVKIDGFDGTMSFTFRDYLETISDIENGKRIDISLNFSAEIVKENLSKKKYINGKVSSLGTLTGDFSLKEFDIIIKNTQVDLISRLSRELKEKI